MQRSRRALLQRRALESAISGRNQRYKVSQFLALWALAFFLNLWICPADDYEGQIAEGPSMLFLPVYLLFFFKLNCIPPKNTI